MPSSGSTPPRRPSKAWELRASVSEAAFAKVEGDAQFLKRHRTVHAGHIVEGFTLALHELAPRERAQLDALLSTPAELAALLRKGLQRVA